MTWNTAEKHWLQSLIEFRVTIRKRIFEVRRRLTNWPDLTTVGFRSVCLVSANPLKESPAVECKQTPVSSMSMNPARQTKFHRNKRVSTLLYTIHFLVRPVNILILSNLLISVTEQNILLQVTNVLFETKCRTNIFFAEIQLNQRWCSGPLIINNAERPTWTRESNRNDTLTLCTFRSTCTALAWKTNGRFYWRFVCFELSCVDNGASGTFLCSGVCYNNVPLYGIS